MKVAIIIPTYNERDNIQELIKDMLFKLKWFIYIGRTDYRDIFDSLETWS